MEYDMVEAVRAGARLWDKKLPGWRDHIDIDWLDMANCDRCVCGQLGDELFNEPIFHATLAWLGAEPGTAFGFDIPKKFMNMSEDDFWPRLRKAWIDEIKNPTTLVEV